jgi:hypothetical protein
MIFRVLDIETVPDDTVWTMGDPSYRLVPSPIQVAAVSAVPIEPFPPPHACRVVALSYVDVGMDPAKESRYYFDRCYSECLWSSDVSQARADAAEHRLLETFSAAMTDPAVTLVTWNGRGFDLPVISMRSLGHKIACGWYYKNRDVRYRFSEDGHLDLMDFLGDYGACRNMKLGDLARLCGLPGKTDMSGDKVADLYAEAVKNPLRSEALQVKVARYCLQDSLQTALLFLRTRYHLGKIDALTHNLALGTFRASPSVTDAIDLDWDRLLL